MWWVALLAFLIFGPLGWIAGLSRWIGDRLPVDRFYLWMFDRIVGRETAREIRDDHVEYVVDYLIEEEAEIEETREELVSEIEAMRRQTEGRFFRGKSVFGILLAGAAVFAPWWFTFILALLLMISIGTRLTAVEVLAFENPDPEIQKERLFAMRVWNNEVLGKSKVARNTVGAKGIRELDKEMYEFYLDKVFIGSLRDQDVLNRNVILQTLWVWNEVLENIKMEENSEDKRVYEDKNKKDEEEDEITSPEKSK